MEFGKWQLQEVIKQIHHWETNGMKTQNIKLSVTASQLENSTYIRKVSEILQQTGFDSGQIIFDIIESKSNINSKSLRQHLIRQPSWVYRFQLGLWHFGRMALHNIADFPINYLKVDDHLVKELVVDMNENSIITSWYR